MTLPQRIVAVADIVSALISQRSYKEPFPKEKTLAILNQMSKTQLDKSVCNYITDNFDSIVLSTEGERQKIVQIYQTIMSEYQDMLPAINKDRVSTHLA